jgi:hypothetical protein
MKNKKTKSILGKPVMTEKGTYILLTEFPEKSLVIEGLRHAPDDTSSDRLISTRIVFSREAIETLIPMLQFWIKEGQDE